MRKARAELSCQLLLSLLQEMVWRGRSRERGPKAARAVQQPPSFPLSPGSLRGSGKAPRIGCPNSHSWGLVDNSLVLIPCSALPSTNEWWGGRRRGGGWLAFLHGCTWTEAPLEEENHSAKRFLSIGNIIYPSLLHMTAEKG